MSDHYEGKHVVSTQTPNISLLFSGPAVKTVDKAAIPVWLQKALQDIKVNPLASLSYGLIFAVVGIFLDYFSPANPSVRLAATAGFLLFGPFLGLGLYDLSRSIEQGEKPKFIHSTLAVIHNMGGLLMYAFAMGALMFFWIRMSTVVMNISFSQAGLLDLSTFNLVRALLQLEGGLVFLLVFFVIGLMFAVGAFVSGVVTVPLLLDQKKDIVTAVNTSVRVVYKNPTVMLLWALSIVVLIGLGIMTFYIGLIITMPVVGHATWHAYRDLVAAADTEAK